MKIFGFVIVFLFSSFVFAQGNDKDLEGKWILFKIIDNMTGEDVEITHKANPEYVYWMTITDNFVKYNLEINKCENEIIVGKGRTIEFKYFSECTEICCDEEFSKVLTYEECTKYYIKEGKTLIMVSEDRIFYFKRAENE